MTNTKLRQSYLLAAVLSAGLISLSGRSYADTMSAAPDNSQMNTGDRASSAVTADQASNTKSDVELMREIRKSVVDDKTLSTYAHNVKIVAKQGKVTLKGVVHTDDEKNNIGMKASAIAGSDNVTNNLTVKGS